MGVVNGRFFFNFLPAKKDKSEKLIFTTLEKEIMTEKEQEKMAMVFIDEILGMTEKTKEKKEPYSNVTTTFGMHYSPTTTATAPHEFDGKSYSAPKEVLCNYQESPNRARHLDKNLTKGSGGVKENEGKLYYELSWEFVEEMAKRMANNKSGKYPLFNWKKNIDVEELKQAINRHHIEVMKGNYKDGNEVLGHIVQYACNSMMLWEQLSKK